MENTKIYIIGPTGSGKTTLAKKIAHELNIPNYELDLLVYDDKENHRKRTEKEIEGLFAKILEKDSWIIEDVGRTKFQRGREEANKIYYLQVPKRVVYKRVMIRWLKQKRNLEPYNYPPTFFQLIDMIKITKSYFKKEKNKIKELERYKEKLEFLKL